MVPAAAHAPAPPLVTRLLAGPLVLLAGLSAGFFVTWEINIVRGLALLDDPSYVAAMNAMNDTVRTGWFASFYFGTGVLALVASVGALLSRAGRRAPGTYALLAGTVVYLGLIIALTTIVNLPLNAELGLTRTVDPVLTAAARAAYEEPWRRANLIRAFASTAAFVLFLLHLRFPRPARGGRRTTVGA